MRKNSSKLVLFCFVILLAFPNVGVASSGHEHHSTPKYKPVKRDTNVKTELQLLIDATPANGILKLKGKTYRGSIVISKPITIEGSENTVIKSLNTIFTVTNTSDVTIRNVTLEADELAIYASNVNNLHLEQLSIKETPAAIQIMKSQQIKINRLNIEGDQGHFAQKKNAIAIHQAQKITISNTNINNMLDGIYLEQIEDVNAFQNKVSGSRYAYHVMYGNDLNFSDNIASQNMTGFMIMVAKHVHISNNQIKEHNQLNSLGSYFYDVQHVIFAENQVEENTIALDILNTNNLEIINNIFSTNGTVLQVRRSETTVVKKNRFFSNILTARADQYNFILERNMYDDFNGYDFNQDGIGDTSYIASNSFGQWMVKKPVYQYYMGSPAVSVLNTLETTVQGNGKSLIIDDLPIMNQTEKVLKWNPKWTQFLICIALLGSIGLGLRRWFV